MLGKKYRATGSRSSIKGIIINTDIGTSLNTSPTVLVSWNKLTFTLIIQTLGSLRWALRWPLGGGFAVIWGIVKNVHSFIVLSAFVMPL